MRKKRLIADGESYYHVVSRIIERKFYLGKTEKERFRSMLWRVAEFSGVEILTYSIMDNHFHLLVKVPERQSVDDDELFRRLALIYSDDVVNDVLLDLNKWQAAELPSGADRVREKYLYRMYDLSEFMKTLKLRFSKWYNRINDRRGPLWEERFRSVLIEGTSYLDNGEINRNAIRTIASYIDLNAVRAGLVDDPKDYRWCGYGDAIAGYLPARK